MKTIIGVESFEEMVERKRARAGKLSRGEPVRAERRIMFETVEDLLACMTPQRVRLMQTVREHPLSLTELASNLQRDRKSVHRDVKVLREAGLVALQRQVNPGHGIVKIVRARAKRMELRAEL